MHRAARADQHHRDALDLHAMGLILVQLGLRDGADEVTRLELSVCMVDADPVPRHQVSTDIGSDLHQSVTECAEQPGAGRPATAAVAPGRGIQARDDRVQRAVEQAGAPSVVVRVLPVGQPRHRRAECADEADTDARPGCCSEPGGPRGQRITSVEHERDRPRPDRHVGERRVQRVPQPRPVQQVAHRVARVTEQVERQSHAVLEPVAGGVQPLLALHHGKRTLRDVGQPSAGHLTPPRRVVHDV
jgi:hypothetical protein